MEALLLPALITLNWALAPGVTASDCSGFRHLENGRTFFRYGGLYVTFSCNPGFRMHGHRTSSCVSGQWARHPPLCVAPGCPRPGKLLHGTTVMSSDGSLTHFACNEGFRLFGSSMLYCKGKTWNGSTPLCKELDIMNSFRQKQTSLYKPGTELNQAGVTNLKHHSGPVAITAAKETFLKPSLLGVPQAKPQLNGDLPEDSQKQPNLGLWHGELTTQARVDTAGLEDTITKLNSMEGFLDRLNQPATTVSSTTLLLAMSSKPTSMFTQQSVTSKFPDQVLSSTRTGEYNLPSTAQTLHEIPVTPSQVLGVSPRTNQDLILAIDSSAAKSYVSGALGDTLEVPTVSPEILKNSELSGKIGILTEASTDEDISQSLQVTQEEVVTVVPTLSSLDLRGSKNSLITPKSFMSSSTSVFSFGIHDGEGSTSAARPDEDFLPKTEVLPTHTPAIYSTSRDLHSKYQAKGTTMIDKERLTSSPLVIPSGIYAEEGSTPEARSDEDFPPRTEVLPTHTSAIHSTPVVPTIDLYLQHGSTMVDKEHLEPRVVVGQTDGELFDIESASSSLLINQKNATAKQMAKHNISVSTSGFPLFPSRKRRPVCPYPPLPSHGTFYFHTIPNPAPFQYKHYIQYACYAGYTLANGDVYSYCLQDGQWSGITPTCIGLTPCSRNNGGCSQVCLVNERNHAECLCDSGFLLLGDRRTCRDLDECAEGLHECQQVCENTFGSYRCGCGLGFQLSSDRTSCTDVNECALPTAMARCVFGCVNTPGSFYCLCPAGYKMNTTDGQCEDIDECTENMGLGPCANACVNTPGAFQCVCSNGYQLAGDGVNCIPKCPPGYRSDPPVGNETVELAALPCIDINECEEMERMQHHQQHKCDWKCVNLPGTHRCICPRGYIRHPNGYQCKDINECTLKNGGCSHICLNHRGGYKCACPENYRLSYSRKKCQPVLNPQRIVS